MTNEQREAIELVEYIADNTWTTKYIMSSDSKKADTVLSLIKEQQKEIEKYKALYDRALSDLVKADKQIDLYIDELICNEFDRCCQECCKECEKDKDTLGYCIKQYFASLVEKE